MTKKIEKSAIIALFEKHFGAIGHNLIFCSSPGRVNLLGEHIDYNDGFVLPAAVDKSIIFAATPRTDTNIQLYSEFYDQKTEFSISPAVQSLASEPLKEERKPNITSGATAWNIFAQEIVYLANENVLNLKGMNAVVAGDLLPSRGLGSSAAFSVGFLKTLLALNNKEMEPIEAAYICQEAESLALSVDCGLMDQICCLSAVADQLVYFDCFRELLIEQIPFPSGAKDNYILAVVHSGLARELSETAYNERRDESEEIFEILQNELSRQVQSFQDLKMEDIQEADEQGYLSDTQIARCRHIVTEIARVKRGVAALKNLDLAHFGNLMTQSHKSLRDDYEVSCPELDFLVDTAISISGVLGAKMTGAGFGGCIVALLTDESKADFAEKIQAAYTEKFNQQAENFPEHQIEIFFTKPQNGCTIEK